MLSVYFDESGSHLDSSIFVVAGLLAPPLQWERLATEWQRVLAEENLTDFHMKHCAHGVKAFSHESGWNKERRDRLMIRLVNIIKRHVHYRTWSAVVMEDYRKIFRGDRRERVPYSMGVYGCASRIRSLAMSKSPEIFVPCMLDRGGKGSGRTAQLLNSLQPTYYRMHPVSFGDRTLALPLQAADLHAYEVHKYFADQIVAGKGGHGRPVRQSMRELMRIPEAGSGGYLFTGKKLIQMLAFMVEVRRNAGDGPLPTEGAVMDIPPDQLNESRRVYLRPFEDGEVRPSIADAFRDVLGDPVDSSVAGG